MKRSPVMRHLKKLKKSAPTQALYDLPEIGRDAESIAADVRRYYGGFLGRDKDCRSSYYPYQAVALAVRDRLMAGLGATRRAVEDGDLRKTFYLSMEFLMGRALRSMLMNLGLQGPAAEALEALGLDLEELVDSEHDAGLGNGGLGRLAACFLDSCATLSLPVTGYGIRYEYGMFRQRIEDGRQVEEPDHWLRGGNAWEIECPERARRIRFNGRTEFHKDEEGRLRASWVDTNDVLALPYDAPIPGYQNGVVNVLRLWKGLATDEFDLGEFNAGLYPESVSAKVAAENITMVLYPNDSSENGKDLRLRQQYFLASASLQDVLDSWVERHGKDFSAFAEKNGFHLNDTHPSCVVPELMRLLMDEHGLEWDAAWSIVRATVAYTNHTLLPEALERWPVSLFGRLLPRLLEIVYEINSRFLAEASLLWPGDNERLARMSIIEDSEDAHVRMANLAVVAAHSVNGVAELHSKLLREGLFSDFHAMEPAKFNNKTNGVTHRRWLAGANPLLAALATKAVGEGWMTRPEELSRLAAFAEDAGFQEEWSAVKQANKAKLVKLVSRDCGQALDPDSMFDVQVKRIHEYKRQLLNLLHAVHLYAALKDGCVPDPIARTVLIGGKAAPGYFMAKLVVSLACKVAETINADPGTRDLLRLVFLPDYRVSTMEVVSPAADLSEQISTAGKEASGTGNMKLMMNGALTIGTLDGANVEILDAVGEENFFLFGLTAPEVEAARHGYDPDAIVSGDHDLRRAVDLIASGHFNRPQPGLFDPILAALRSPTDPWLVAADFRSYLDAQKRAAAAFADKGRWAKMSILNSAASGRFSTDRTIREYNEGIWRMDPIPPLRGF